MTVKHVPYALLAPIVLLMTMLACTGQLATMQISDEPVYECPTSTPRPTHTPRPTDVQPNIQIPPSGWMPYTPVPGCRYFYGYCYAFTPVPGGRYTNPGYTVPGATSTPRPTYTPYPTPTPYVIRPPQDFYQGDPVDAGGFVSTVDVRFVLNDVVTIPATPDDSGALRNIVRWTLSVTNDGVVPYEFFPAGQVFISQMDASGNIIAGVWGAGQAAADEVGLSFDYATYSVGVGQTRRVELAAYIPAGSPVQFTYLLDPTQAVNPNTITWTVERNPHCQAATPTPFVVVITLVSP